MNTKPELLMFWYESLFWCVDLPCILIIGIWALDWWIEIMYGDLFHDKS